MNVLFRKQISRNSIEICVGLTQHKEEIRNLSEKKERYNTNTRKITPPFFLGGFHKKKQEKKKININRTRKTLNLNKELNKDRY